MADLHEISALMKLAVADRFSLFAQSLRDYTRTLGAIPLAALLLAGCISSTPEELINSSSTQTNPVINDEVATGLKKTTPEDEEDERPEALRAQLEADSGKQQLVELGDGFTVSVPSPRNYALNTQVAENTDAAKKESVVAENSETSTGNALPLTMASATNVSDPNTKPENRATLALAPVTEDKQVASSSASADAAEKQATASLNEPINKGGFLARFFRRPKVDVGASDDRNNPLLASTRSDSQAAKKGLPGVKSNLELFGTSNKKNSNIKLASVGGFGRLSPLDIETQHSGVEVGCIRPDVVRLLKVVERHYGKKPVVSSGYRSPSRNRRAGGARNSMHMYCKAVDIQVPGVSKWKLAKFLRTVPGRGGVGTYCRTKSVHLDVGPKRDWHYSCRRKSKRRRKA